MQDRTKLVINSLLIILVVIISFIVRFYAAGWLFFPIGSVIYLIITFFHCWFHYRFVEFTKHIGWLAILAIVLSHFLFISAFLLQYDYGDGPGWLTITFLLRGMAEDPIKGTLWEKQVLIMNLLVFLPVCISWYPLKRNKGTA